MSTGALKNNVKIMVFGTFDGVHEGHLNFLHQAKGLSKHSFLIVSIARDKNVFKIKGKTPTFNEKKRAALIKETRLADKIVLGGIKDHIPHIKKENPNIIALGYDQKAYVMGLKKELKKIGLSTRVIRLKPYKETIYKNSLLKKKAVI